jgi:hypothetical protein
MALTQVQDGMLGYDGGSFANRNRIINGDMRIDQRNAGASVTPTNGQYSLDRWKYYSSQTSKVSIQQNASSVTPPAGFKNYLGVTSLSAYSVTASDYFTITQLVEGFNMADFGYGAAGASTVTLSFWVRSSLTGTFGGSLTNDVANYAYPFTYSISVANTWEQKSITITGATAGTWQSTNAAGIQVLFALGAGSTYSGTAGAWVAAGFLPSATGATSVVGTNGATFYITGVQLEAGSVATPFEHRQFGTEAFLCYRYFQKSFPYGTAPANGLVLYGDSASTTSYATATPYIHVTYPVQLRTIPTTVDLYNPRVGGVAGQATNGASDAASTAVVNSGEKGFMVQTAAQPANNWYVHWTATSEL